MYVHTFSMQNPCKDVVIFVFREEYYLDRKIPISNNKKLLEWQKKMSKIQGVSEIIIAKQRNGPIGNFNLKYDKKTTSFENIRF